MDEVLLKQLVRQVKILNFWVSFFGVLILASFVIAGILVWKAVTYIHNAEKSISHIQTQTSQTLNVQNQLCGNSALKTLASSSNLCK